MFLHKKKTGFTLVEMLIVIVIIGILASALIPKLRGMQDRAKRTALEHAVKDIRTTVFLAQSDTGQTMVELTGSTCSMCLCRIPGTGNVGYGLLENVSSSCSVQRRSNLRVIESAAGMPANSLSKYDDNPRGHPYMLDENEGDAAHNSSDCVSDSLWSTFSSDSWEEEYLGDEEYFMTFDLPGVRCNSY